MLLQNARTKFHESRFGCHASLMEYITAMKTRTGTPSFANPSRKRLCDDLGALRLKGDDMLHLHDDDMILWPLASSFYTITVQEREWIAQKFYQMSLHIHCYMSSAYSLHHEIGIICVSDDIGAKIPWLEPFLVLWDLIMDGAIIFITGWYPWYPPKQDIWFRRRVCKCPIPDEWFSCNFIYWYLRPWWCSEQISSYILLLKPLGCITTWSMLFGTIKISES